MSPMIEARRYANCLALPSDADERIVAEVCRRDAMIGMACREGGHIETVVDEVLGDLLDAEHPTEEWLEIPRSKAQRREALERAAVSDDAEVMASFETLWRTMRQFRGALIAEETTRLIGRWLER